MNKALLKAHLALFAVAFFYGANYSVAKLVMPEYIGPRGFIGLRILSATLLFWLFERTFIQQRVERKDFLRLAVSGFFGVCANQLLFFEGLERTSPISASLIMMTTPLLVLLASVVLLKEKVGWVKALGIGLGLAGAVVLISSTAEDKSARAPGLGNLLVMLNATCYAIYLIVVKPLMRKYHPLVVVKWAFTFGALFALPFAIPQMRSIQWHTFTQETWLAVAFVLFCVTFLAYLFNAVALKTVSATVVSTYIYLQPLLATLIAVLLGVDQPSWIMFVAGLLIFTGVLLVAQRNAAAKRQSS